MFCLHFLFSRNHCFNLLIVLKRKQFFCFACYLRLGSYEGHLFCLMYSGLSFDLRLPVYGEEILPHKYEFYHVMDKFEIFLN